MLKELIAAQLAHQVADVQSVLKEIVTRGEAQTDRQGKAVDRATDRLADKLVDRRLADTVERGARADATRPATATAPPLATPTTTAPPSPEQVQRALQNLQAQNGLPITGRFDDATATLLRNLGAVPPAPATTSTTKPVEPRKPVDPAQQAAGRQRSTGVEQQLRSRLQQQHGRDARQTPADSKPVDRALDPARLLASLFGAGFNGAGAEQALASFQAAHKLPPSGRLDPRTVDALVAADRLPAASGEAHVDVDARKAAAGTTAAMSTALAAERGRAAAARATTKATTDAHGADAAAVRAPASSPSDARERARVESLLAQAAARERGVQETHGEPTAVLGHGQTHGAAAGLSGAGGAQGGVGDHGDEGALSTDDGSRGDESSNANAHAGDDDHEDAERGEASAALGVDAFDDDDGVPDGHHRVPPLGAQVRAALGAVFRIDDSSVPVHYTWDVSLFRPGVYADGQPAEVIWHLVVDRAHAFDPVWQRAVDAIGARLLYLDPDAEPLFLDDVLAALRQARVR